MKRDKSPFALNTIAIITYTLHRTDREIAQKNLKLNHQQEES